MLIVALVYWGKVINNLVIFWNVKNLKYKMQKQPSTGVLKKGIMDFFFKKKQKIKNLKNGQSHWKTLRYILLKISSSKNISQEYLRRPQEDLFSRTALGGQIAQFLDKILSKHQCRFRKGNNAQHSLIVFLEKWKESADQGHVFRALLTNFSKAFDCL